MKAGYITCLYFLYICIMEEKTVIRDLHKLLVFSLKVIPMLLALTALLNTILSYMDTDIPLLSYIGGVSVLPILFLYLSSYAFRFCSYHRMFLHYVALNWILNIYDYYWGIPVSDKSLFLIYMIITGVFLFLILYLHQKHRKIIKY